jgi:F420-0:gamma-glutamyl ligase-like protein
LPLTVKPIRTKYWRPGDDFLGIIDDSISGFCHDRDIVVISEKALSVASGRVVDESKFSPGLMAKFLARYWMRLVWGFFLAPLCHFSKKTVRHLRGFPIPEGESHKEVALRHAGFFQSLLHYSEGGIDVTNLPYAFAALPLPNPDEIAKIVVREVKLSCGLDVSVMITDTDKTYSKGRIHLTPRPHAAKGIVSLGLFAVILGRAFRWDAQATPLAVSDQTMRVDYALALADLADQARGFGAGRTVWDMARTFRVGYSEVTWEMLEHIEHYPIVVIRKD